MRHGIAILTAAALLAGSAATAQAQVRYGVIGGLSQSTLTGGGSQGITWRTTFLAGVTGILPLGETFSIRSELHYATKGARAKVVGTSAAAFELAYLELPLLLQVGAPPGYPLRPHLYGGMSAGALIGCSREGVDCDADPNFRGHEFDTGLVVGAEMEAFGAALGARYEAGLSTVRAGLRGLEIVNGVLSFTVGYLFPR